MNAGPPLCSPGHLEDKWRNKAVQPPSLSIEYALVHLTDTLSNQTTH